MRTRGLRALSAASSQAGGLRGFAEDPGAPKKILAVLYKAGEAAKQPRMLGAALLVLDRLLKTCCDLGMPQRHCSDNGSHSVPLPQAAWRTS